MTVLLRPWTPADAAALLGALEDAEDLALQFAPKEAATLEEAETLVEEALLSGETRRIWAITENERPIGNVGLSAIEWRHETAWAHYWLAVDARGRGLAARALAAAADWAFEEGLFRLELGHRLNNPASCRVAASAGFRAEGIERAKLRYGRERFDVETHARLRTDPSPGLERLKILLP